MEEINYPRQLDPWGVLVSMKLQVENLNVSSSDTEKSGEILGALLPKVLRKPKTVLNASRKILNVRARDSRRNACWRH